MSTGPAKSPLSPAMERFAANLKAARLARGLTQQQFCDRLGSAGFVSHQSTIFKFESGWRRYVTLDEAVAFAKVLGVTPAGLLGLDYMPPPTPDPLTFADALRDSAKALVKAADELAPLT